MSANGRLALMLVLIALSAGMIVPLSHFGLFALPLLLIIPLFAVIVMVLKPRS